MKRCIGQPFPISEFVFLRASSPRTGNGIVSIDRPALVRNEKFRRDQQRTTELTSSMAQISLDHWVGTILMIQNISG
jgi:hypothetical protein